MDGDERSVEPNEEEAVLEDAIEEGREQNPTQKSSYTPYAVVLHLTQNNTIEQRYQNSGMDYISQQFELCKGFTEVIRLELYSLGANGARILMHQWDRPRKEMRR